MTIEIIENGYLLIDSREKKHACQSVEELFNKLLFQLECRSKHFGGQHYGHVFVATEPDQTFTSPSPDPA